MQIFYNWSSLPAGFCPGPSLELKAAGEAGMLTVPKVKEVWGLGRGCASQKDKWVGCEFPS